MDATRRLAPCCDGVILTAPQEPPANPWRALDALEEDHAYLLAGGAFSEALIVRWIAVKQAKAEAVAGQPHPHEFSLYFDL